MLHAEQRTHLRERPRLMNNNRPNQGETTTTRTTRGGSGNVIEPRPVPLSLGLARYVRTGRRRRRLPVGLPLSDAAASQQWCDLAGDGQHATFVTGFGLQTHHF